MTYYFDLISLIAGLICIQTLWQLFQNWSKFWDAQVTFKDQEMANQLAVFVLIPISVLLHEIGHSLATWQVGGTVLTFQWRFYWGYIIPSGNFSSAEYWWIAFSGNLVSILLGLLSILLISRIRRRIVGEVLYSYAWAELFYSLVWYPLVSLVAQGGDWVKIYDFAVQPYASITLVAHTVLMWGLWQLYRSQKALHWQLARNSNTLDTWGNLKTDVSNHSNDLQPHLELAYFLLQHNQVYEAKKIAKEIYQIAPNDQQVLVFGVVMDCSDRAYRKAIRLGRKLLNIDLSSEDQLRLYRTLCFCQYKIRRLPAALSYANQGLTLAPKDYKLRCYRAAIYSALRQHQEEREDLNVALESAPNQDSREYIQYWLKQYLKHV